MPRRGPEAGFHRIHYDFHGSWSEPHRFMPVSREQKYSQFQDIDKKLKHYSKQLEYGTEYELEQKNGKEGD